MYSNCCYSPETYLRLNKIFIENVRRAGILLLFSCNRTSQALTSRELSSQSLSWWNKCLSREDKGGKTGRKNTVLSSVSGVWDKWKIRHKSQISSDTDLVQPSTCSPGKKIIECEEKQRQHTVDKKRNIKGIKRDVWKQPNIKRDWEKSIPPLKRHALHVQTWPTYVWLSNLWETWSWPANRLAINYPF